MSLELAAFNPIERTTRLATNNPPARRIPIPTNSPIIIHMRDLDEDELPEEDPSAMFLFLPSGHSSPGFKFGRCAVGETRNAAEMCSKRSCS